MATMIDNTRESNPLRNQREIMERPFFSLTKNKRTAPIIYSSPDGSVRVEITAPPTSGIANMYDSDIMIWFISQLNTRRNAAIAAGEDPLTVSQTIEFRTIDLLIAINRRCDGPGYASVRAALLRLQSTQVKTNIRSKGRDHLRAFSWIAEFSETLEPGKPRMARVTVSDWVYEGVMMGNHVLSLHPQYFHLKGQIARWLYQVARKHAGDQPGGFSMALKTLYEKSSAQGTLAQFKLDLRELLEKQKNRLLDYRIEMNGPRGAEVVHMVLTKDLPGTPVIEVKTKAQLEAERAPRKPRAPKPEPAHGLKLTAETVARFQQTYPWQDATEWKERFDKWLDTQPPRPERTEADYNKVFWAWMKEAYRRLNGGG